MRAEQLLRLYPRAWRARYGEEFVAITGSGRLSVQQRIDIIYGAIDAWLSTDVRHATRAAGVAASGGGNMTVRTMICGSRNARYTTRDSLIGAAVMLSLTVVLAFGGTALKRNGWLTSGEVVQSLSFFVPFMLSMPFWLTKGQPWKAQAAIVGATVALLMLIAWLAAVT